MLSLGGDLTHKDVSRLYVGTNTDDSRLVKIGQSLGSNIGNIAGDLFGSNLCVPCLHLKDVHVY